MIQLIIACEIAFWLALLIGLAVRYLAHCQKLSSRILWSIPALSAFLLVAAFVRLLGGAVADWTDALAFTYLGFTVVFGPDLIRWADVRFAHRFSGGPPPPRR
jgi:hypothetical protein